MSKYEPSCLNSNDVDCIEQLTLFVRGVANCLETTDADQETVDTLKQIGESAVEATSRALSDKQSEINDLREQVSSQAKSNAEDRQKITQLEDELAKRAEYDANTRKKITELEETVEKDTWAALATSASVAMRNRVHTGVMTTELTERSGSTRDPSSRARVPQAKK